MAVNDTHSIVPVVSPASSRVDTVRCRAHPCDQIKKSSNNWFIVWADDPRGMFHCVGYTAEMLAEVGDQARTVCGPGCAQRMLEKFLSGVAI